jgi:hypothetical protein
MCLSPGQNFTITQINVGDIFTMLAVQVNNCRRLNADGSMIYQGC